MFFPQIYKVSVQISKDLYCLTSVLKLDVIFGNELFPFFFFSLFFDQSNTSIKVPNIEPYSAVSSFLFFFSTVWTVAVI